ncbi:E3 UFM1-protein ligase 1 [Holothuria leucospilota]|uniref:E3 UFM1-protein ligase 1 n=1 Tax=Holothuria leucospilota TaxID=206669 RepID=A0A9Q0YT29_HOLLE|nr:E3 UFM1-protein ligase 1 [Holothuria leucospilota]
MASDEWEEVKRLAADFKRAQLTSSAQRLSERNCVEIVSKLIQDKQIDVIFTLNGKEYLTPAQVVKEIKDELIVHGGRVNLVDLQDILGVDYSYIEAKAAELIKNDSSTFLVLGQLVHNTFLDHLAEEINEQLQAEGQVSIPELTRSHDLPPDFLLHAIEKRIGTLIEGQIDPYDKDVIFTQAFVDRNRARVRGVFSAITRPTPVLTILNKYKFPEKLFYSLLEDLVSCGRLNGDIVGGRQDNASYVPEIYSKTQNNWMDSFYAQNGYLEYDTLSRLGVSDPKNYIKKRFKGEKFIHLKAASVGKGLQDQVDATIDEAVRSETWVDIMPVLPSSFSGSDISQLIQQVLKSKPKVEVKVFHDSIVCSKPFLNECVKLFEPVMKEKAAKDAETHRDFFQQIDKKAVAAFSGSDVKADKKDERRKKAAGGSTSKGMGTGRESKTKKVKKARNRDVDEDVSSETSGSRGQSQELAFHPVEKIEEILREKIQDCPDELYTELAEDLLRPLTKQYQETAREAFMAVSGGSSAAERRKTHEDLQEKVNSVLTNVKLFEKGISQFKDEDVVSQLNKYLLKTLCTEITNCIFNTIATEQMMAQTESTDLTAEMRAKILSKLSEDDRAPFAKLNSAINGKDLSEFYSRLEECCSSSICDIMLKKLDKKKERPLIFNHKQAVVAQLKDETDPALALHLTTTLAFQNCTQCMLYAPGRLVPQIISFLASHLNKEQHNILLQYQGLVQKQIGLEREKEENAVADAEKSMSEVKGQLEDLLAKVKDVALVKKSASVSSD